MEANEERSESTTQSGSKQRRREVTVGESNDIAGSFGFCHSPHILYRVGLAFTGLSTEVVREVATTSDGRGVIGSDPLEVEALVLNPCTEDGGENKADKVEIAL